MGIANVYERGGKVYIAATNGVISFEPVEVVSTGDDLAAAIRRALGTAQPDPGPNVDLRSYRSPVLIASGVRRWKEFERRLKFVTVESGEEGYLVRKYVPDVANGRGFDPDGILFRLPPGDQYETIAAKLKDALSDPNWPTH